VEHSDVMDHRGDVVGLNRVLHFSRVCWSSADRMCGEDMMGWCC